MTRVIEGYSSASPGIRRGCIELNWRLPNSKELFSLVDLGKFNPALPTGHPFANVEASHYWSSTTYVNYSGDSWFVHFSDGSVNRTGKSYGCYVRAVRGGQ